MTSTTKKALDRPFKIEGSPVVNLTPVKGGEARRILPGTPEWDRLRREARDCPWESYLRRS